MLGEVNGNIFTSRTRTLPRAVLRALFGCVQKPRPDFVSRKRFYKTAYLACSITNMHCANNDTSCTEMSIFSCFD